MVRCYGFVGKETSVIVLGMAEFSLGNLFE